MLSDMPGFRGVHASDEVPIIQPRRKPQCFVMNIDPSDMAGSHWVALCVAKLSNKAVIELFDSYGSSLTGLNLPPRWMFRQNKHRLQDYSSDVCGHYSIFFTRKRLSGVPFQNIVRFLQKSKNPDKTVKAYVTRLKKKLKNQVSTPGTGGGQICLPNSGDCIRLPLSIRVRKRQRTLI